MATEYRKAMMPSTRKPGIGAGWITTVASAVVAVALAVIANRFDIGTPTANALWIAALVFGSVALLAWYAVAVHWARRRKRLWG